MNFKCVSDKETKKEIRERALLKYQEKLSLKTKSKAEKQNAEKKYALETMMKVKCDETINCYKSGVKLIMTQTTTALSAFSLKRRKETASRK